jgi:cell division protein FtsZ
MPPMSPDDAYKREITPEPQHEAEADVYEMGEDQWAVLRHEVEVEDMKEESRDGRDSSHSSVPQSWSDHGQRDTEEDGMYPQPSVSVSQDVFAAPATAAPSTNQTEHHVDIVVAGVGGGGMNAVNRMISTGVRGVRFIAMNTDSQVLALSQASKRICLGQHYTKGLGAGGNASVGTRAASESEQEIRAALGSADLVFIAAGMGGGTGTGATPVVASIAKKLGALTIGIVTLPFPFEGTRRRRIAEAGIAELSAVIDALIVVPNDRLLSLPGHDRSLSDAFKLADDVLRQGVQGIAEVINVPGLVNVDFADVRSVLQEAGTALMSIGQGQGRNRAQRSAEEAIAGGFLNVTIRGAQRVLFNISGGEDMTLFEVNEVAECITNAVNYTADITFGAVIDPTLHDTIRVTLIAAGMEERREIRSVAANPIQAASYIAPTATPPATPVQAKPAGYAEVQPEKFVPPASPALQKRLPDPSSRPQRSLDDLRGLLSLGHRQERSRAMQAGQEIEEVDIPPFLRRPN